MSAFGFKRRKLALLVVSAFAGTALVGCFGGDDDEPPPEVAADYTEGAPDLDWGESLTVTAFAPAQRSWQWMVREEPDIVSGVRHPSQGANALRAGTACSTCHDGDDLDAPAPSTLGARLVGADADPIPGKVGFRDITVQAAYTTDKFYLKVSWQTQQDRPGATHHLHTFKAGDETWATLNKYKPTALLDDGYDAYATEDHFSLMFLPASKNVPVEPNSAVPSQASFHSVGCWATCHTDATRMTDWNGTTPTAKYLLSTRVAGWGSEQIPAEDIAALKAAGEFPDLWHFRNARTAPAQTLTDALLLATRGADADDDNPFGANALDGNGNPTWMYDRAIMGFSALPRADWTALMENAPPLIVDGPNKNAVPFDATATFADGAFIPAWVLKPVESLTPAGSRADVKSYSKWEDGTWTVIFERARDTGHDDDHDLNPDVENYSFAFAVYDDHADVRWHHVTFPVTLGKEGADVDVQARFNP